VFEAEADMYTPFCGVLRSVELSESAQLMALPGVWAVAISSSTSGERGVRVTL